MKFSNEEYNICKRMFIEENMSPKSISEEMGGKPAETTLQNWAKKKDRKGKTWFDYRDKYRADSYEQASPEAMARKILDRINVILSKTDFTTKDADALAKLQKALEKITDPRYQIPVMFDMLTEFTLFMKSDYDHLLNKEMIMAIRHFKNKLRKRLEK
jgi:hypothetical protein